MSDSNPVHGLISGASAGAVASVVCAPLDITKVGKSVRCSDVIVSLIVESSLYCELQCSGGVWCGVYIPSYWRCHYLIV